MPKRLALVFVLYELAVSYLKDSRGGGTGRATARQLFCLGYFFRAARLNTIACEYIMNEER